MPATIEDTDVSLPVTAPAATAAPTRAPAPAIAVRIAAGLLLLAAAGIGGWALTHPAPAMHLVAAKEAPGAPTPAEPPKTNTPTEPAVADATRININTASQAQLELLLGIGPTLAQRIIAERESRGPFASPEQLTRVKGIGPKTLEKLRPHVRTQ